MSRTYDELTKQQEQQKQLAIVETGTVPAELQAELDAMREAVARCGRALHDSQHERGRHRRETTMRDRTLSEAFALELMREGKPLTKMHTHNGMRWFVVPGGQVTDAVARRILARRDVQPRDSGLFPGCEQTFQLRGDWRGRDS